MKNTVKNLLIAAVMICAVAGASYGVTARVIAAENGKTVALPTVYHTAASPLAAALGQPDGEEEKNYTLAEGEEEPLTDTVIMGMLGDYFGFEDITEWDTEPTANDITMEQAAEIGMEGLISVFGIDPTGKEVIMTYYPSRYGLRPYWEGRYNYLPNEFRNPEAYNFEVDSVTGELYTMYSARNIISNVLRGTDPALEKGGIEKYKPFVEEAALKFDLVGGDIKGIGYAGGGGVIEPCVAFMVVGENGSRAKVSISRHDNALMEIVYEAGLNVKDAYHEVMQNEINTILRRVRLYFEANPDAETYLDEETGSEFKRKEVMNNPFVGR
jgi:hypothetical protein